LAKENYLEVLAIY